MPTKFLFAAPIFAFGLVAFGFLGMGPVTIAVDSYGPVTDNAQSVYELSQIEGEDRRREQELSRHQRQQRGILGEVIRNRHQQHDYEAHPEGRHVAGDKAGQNVEGGAAVLRAVGDLFDVTRICANEDLRELRNQRASDGPAANDDGKHPPERWANTSLVSEQVVRGDESNADRNSRGYPDEVR